MSFEELPSGISVVIPVYNSQETLEALLERLARTLPMLDERFEVILVNDGSRDASWATITRLAGTYPWLRAANLMRNYGQHNALLCGTRLARYATIVTMDDDLQHPPEEIHKLLKELEQGFDVVYGAPAELPHSAWRNLFSFLFKRVLSAVMGVRNLRDFSAFRAFRTRLRQAFASNNNPNVLMDVLLSWGTTRFTTISVREDTRLHGQSGYTFTKLVKYALTVLTGFSTAPLRFASMLGFVFTLFGLAVFLYVVGIYFIVGSVEGFPFLASIISIFSGTQLFALGIIGEYLARIFDRSMDRPPYVIAELQERPGYEPILPPAG